MALINCKNCGKKISRKALRCPKCGYAQFVVCEDCNTELSIYHQGDCPECGNPDIEKLIDQYYPEFNEAAKAEENEEDNEQYYQDDDPELLEIDFGELKFKILVGLAFSFLGSYWWSEGFSKHGILELLPVISILFLTAAVFSRLFGTITFIGIFVYLYSTIVEHFFK